MTKTVVQNSQGLALRSRDLESEYQRLAGSERDEDVIRCRAIKRELEQIATAFLRAHDGKRHRGG